MVLEQAAAKAGTHEAVWWVRDNFTQSLPEHNMAAKAPVPSMLEAEIGASGMIVDFTPTSSIASIEDATSGLVDALKRASLPVVRAAVEELCSFLGEADALASVSKPQLQSLLRVLLGAASAPSKLFYQCARVCGCSCLAFTPDHS